MRRLLFLLFLVSCTSHPNFTTSYIQPSTSTTTTTTTLSEKIFSSYVTPLTNLLSPDYCKISDATSNSPGDKYFYSWSYTSGFPYPAHLPSSQKNIDILLIPISTSDSPFNLSDLQFVESGMRYAQQYYFSMSYHRYAINYTIAPETHWINLSGTLYSEGLYIPKDKSLPGKDAVPHSDLSDFITYQLSKTDSSLNLSSYDIVGLISANHHDFYAGHAYANPQGIPTPSGLVYSTFFKGGSSIVNSYVWAHEIAHAWLGLEDLYDLSDFTNTYLGKWDVMEHAGSPAELNAWMRWRSSWISDSQVRCAYPNATSYHYIESLHISSNNPKLVVIPLTNYSSIVLETHRTNIHNPFNNSTAIYLIDTNYFSGHGPFRLISLLNENTKSFTYFNYTFNLIDSYPDGDYILISSI